MAETATRETRAEKRERLRAERRQEILAGARRVFAEKGFEGTTVADVAREAGVAAGTVYLYYESKLDLFAALSAMLFEAIGRAVNETPAPPDVRGGTAARVHAVFEACSEYRDLVRLVFLNPDPRSEAAKRMQRQDEARMRPLQSLLEQGMETGVVRRADPKILVRMINGAVITALHLSFVQSDGRHAATYEELVTDMIVGALEPRERSQEVARPA